MKSFQMRRLTTALWPFLLGAGWLAWLLGPLLSPARALANRDIAIFHVPLRTIFKDLAELDAPVWNPWLHGGQPILPNPSYGAFYPPSWLVFVAPPAYALSLMTILHAAIAFTGAWRLARHLGCGRGPAALAGVGYVGCGAYLSLLSAYNLFLSMTWLPWILYGADESLRLPPGGRWWRPALLAGGALGLQLLSGEPSPVVMSGLALLALGGSAARRRPAVALRLLVPFLFAVALAAVQLAPTLDRLAGSPRGALPPRIATLWSMRPQRLIEAVFPHAMGDPARAVENLFFGWKLSDTDYPYVESLYPGLVLTILAVSALLVLHIPRRMVWICCLAAGCFLGLGRYNPLYSGVREAIPVLAVFRYPEKFIILTILITVVAGVLGWQRLLDEREAGRNRAADFPLALAAAVLAVALGLVALIFWAPEVGLWFISAHGSPDLTPADRIAALAYLRKEGWAAAATAAAVAFLFVLCRWRRPSRNLLEALAVLLLAADLWHYGHALVRTVPARVYRNPPPLATALLKTRDRVFIQAARTGDPFLLRHRDHDLQSLDTRVNLSLLEPYSSLLWHIPTAFDIDFEMFLTEWGRRAEDVLHSEKPASESLYRYLGVWNVRTFLLQRTLQEQVETLQSSAALPLHKLTNRHVLPRFRFVPMVTFHPGHAAALAAARAAGWRIARSDHWVLPGVRSHTESHTRPPRVLEITDEARRIELQYRALESSFFVVAMTYDKGWQATLDGRSLAAYPTAACQLGVALPAGEHRLVLRFREPLVIPGAAVSLLALAAGAAVLLAPGWRRRMA